MAVAGVEERMPDEATRPGSSSAPDPRLAGVRPLLDLLTQQSVLLAVTLCRTIAEERYDITVSKSVDDAGTVQPEFWWEVDRLTSDAEGQPRRERRWGLGLRAYETPEAAYLAAVHWVEHHQVVPPMGTDNTMQ